MIIVNLNKMKAKIRSIIIWHFHICVFPEQQRKRKKNHYSWTWLCVAACLLLIFVNMCRGHTCMLAWHLIRVNSDILSFDRKRTKISRILFLAHSDNMSPFTIVQSIKNSWQPKQRMKKKMLFSLYSSTTSVSVFFFLQVICF